MSEVNVKIEYGALSDPLEEQLNRQGFTLGKELDHIVRLQHALTMCMFHLMTDAQYKSCLKKFHKKVMKDVKQL